MKSLPFKSNQYLGSLYVYSRHEYHFMYSVGSVGNTKETVFWDYCIMWLMHVPSLLFEGGSSLI